MSIVFCHRCEKEVDTDFFPEHFNDNEECVDYLDNEEILVNKIEYQKLKESNDKRGEMLIKLYTLVRQECPEWESIHVKTDNIFIKQTP